MVSSFSPIKVKVKLVSVNTITIVQSISSNVKVGMGGYVGLGKAYIITIGDLGDKITVIR